jgi:hypothetical protein
MLRLGSILLIFLLTVPIVRDCCLPVIHTPQCHESKRTDDVTCSASEQAITETKAAFARNTTSDCELPVADETYFGVLTCTRSAPTPITALIIPSFDLYLRTGALLI